MANEKDLLQNTGMNEAKEDGNRAEKSQESEGKILHNVNDIMDQLMAYGDAWKVWYGIEGSAFACLWLRR